MKARERLEATTSNKETLRVLLQGVSEMSKEEIDKKYKEGLIKKLICEGTVTRTLSNTAKSAIITIFGYISGIIAQLMLYPLFGIQVDILAMLAIGLVFTAVAFISNYAAIKFIELFEKEKPLE